MTIKWLKDDWSAAGFLNFFAQLFWAGYLIIFIIYTAMYILHIFGIFPGILWDLSVRVSLENFEQVYGINESGVNVFTNTSMNVNLSSLNEAYQSSWLYHLAAILKLGLYGAALYGLTLIKRILESIIDEKPWQGQNIKRLNIIGYMMVLAVPYNYGIGWITYLLVQKTELPEQISLLPPLPHFEIGLAGVVVGLVAYLFNEGTKLYEEQKLTV
ncbi:MAG: DUF2975 domain-containing protein [Balneolaceae bacterium]|nr:DUF2975 domain-containing protein [Balneolaceae bacterium]